MRVCYLARLTLGLLLCTSIGCSSEEPPGPDAGPGDAGPADADTPPADATGDAVTGDADPYADTCLEVVIDCLEVVDSCTQVPGPTGSMFTFGNGATYEEDFLSGTARAVAADGTECWTRAPDPMDPTVSVFTAGGEEYRELVGDTGRTITCPDGTEQTAPLGDPAYVTALDADSCPAAE